MSAVVKEWDSMWDGIIGRRYKAHQAWYARGRTGEGRMVLVDENLQGACVVSLSGVLFTRCDLSGALLGSSFMDDAEIIDCTFFDARMVRSSWERSVLTRCNFAASYLGAADFVDAKIDGCDWSNARLEAVIWRRARVKKSTFVGAHLYGAIFVEAAFEGCSFERAMLSVEPKDEGGNTSSCTSARFTDCDFRGANITGLRLNNTTFERCKFHGVIGAPVLEGPVTIIDADFSPDADGSELRSQADVVAQWAGGSAP